MPGPHARSIAAPQQYQIYWMKLMFHNDPASSPDILWKGRAARTRGTHVHNISFLAENLPMHVLVSIIYSTCSLLHHHSGQGAWLHTQWSGPGTCAQFANKVYIPIAQLNQSRPTCLQAGGPLHLTSACHAAHLPLCAVPSTQYCLHSVHSAVLLPDRSATTAAAASYEGNMLLNPCCYQTTNNNVVSCRLHVGICQPHKVTRGQWPAATWSHYGKLIFH